MTDFEPWLLWLQWPAHQTTLGRTCGHCGALNCAGHVSLPTQAKHEQAPVEETRDYWSVCAACGLVKAYCRCH